MRWKTQGRRQRCCLVVGLQLEYLRSWSYNKGSSCPCSSYRGSGRWLSLKHEATWSRAFETVLWSKIDLDARLNSPVLDALAKEQKKRILCRGGTESMNGSFPSSSPEVNRRHLDQLRSYSAVVDAVRAEERATPPRCQ